MLEDLIYRISSWFPSGGGESIVGHSQLPLSYICCIGGALILSKFTGSFGMVTTPLHAAALFLGAKAATMLLDRFDMPMDHQLAQPMLATISGMTMVALLVMAFHKRDGSATAS